MGLSCTITVLAILFSPSIFIICEESLSTAVIVPHCIGMKTNSIAVTHMHVTWSNIVYFRRDVDNMLQRLFLFGLTM